ncbi:hypothetical protein [Gimesia aquarii]|nr:hypothetical protein [Gimesia aquarii]
MAEKYFVECDCGKRVRVELYEAGTEKACHSCHKSVMVPDTITLQESSGDKYPMMRPIEKIRRTLELGEPPFDGLCHHCEDADATFAVPITLSVLIERHMDHDGGIRPTLNGGVKLVAAAAEEFWQETAFPLLLCQKCHSEFQSAQAAASMKRKLGLVGLVGLLIAFLVFAYFNAELVALFAGIFWLIGAFAWAARFRDTKKIEPYIVAWLNDIRWVPETLALEDEYHLTVESSKKF